MGYKNPDFRCAFLNPENFCPDGWVDGDQKFPSIFLILMYAKAHVYMHLYMYSKVVTKILWVSKFDIKFGSVGDFSDFWFQTCHLPLENGEAAYRS